MTRVLLPTVLRADAGGNKHVEVNADTVGRALVELTNAYPELRGQLFSEDGALRNHVNVFVGDENIRDREDLQTVLNPHDEVLIVPALAGG